MGSRASIPILDMSVPRDRSRLKAMMSGRMVDNAPTLQAVQRIVEEVKKRGDEALFEYARRFDGVAVNARSVRLDPAAVRGCGAQTPKDLQKTIREAARRIRAYHSRQTAVEFLLRTAEGTLSQVVKPLDRVGVYIPGGHAPYPSTVLMDIIPAQIAGVREIVAVTPGRGGLDPRIAFVLDLLKVKEVYQIGGAHAIAALAFGTKSIRPVDKIVGPGNSFVSLAKKLVYGVVDIDMVAGPSEVVVMADRSADPSWVALDLLAQAEHGSGDEMAICITEDAAAAERVRESLVREIEGSEQKERFGKLAPFALCICVTDSREASLALVNDIAPEHLQIMTRTCRSDVKKVRNAAAVFLGPYTPVALGDYFVGTNHVLPTGRAARFASPLGVESFRKRISIAEVTANGLRKAAPHVSRFARAEGFVTHALSVERRAPATK